MKKGQSGRSGYPPEAKLVCDMLTGNTNPLVTITFLERPNPLLRRGQSHPRSMGFIIERFGKGLRLVVTCKHAVSFFSMPIYTSLVAFKNPKITTLTCIGSPIEDPERESDIAFLLVRDPLNAPTEPLMLHTEDFQITDGMTLYNARNQCNMFDRTYNVDVTAQPVQDPKQMVFCKLREKDTHIVPMENQAECLSWQQQGFLGYRALVMISRPGYSGSPIWDNQLRLHGMDVRGSDADSEGDTTVCIPSADLYAARQRIDATLKRQLTLQ